MSKCKHEIFNGKCDLCSTYEFNKCVGENICACYEPVTNGDRIRAMTDEELAEFINRVREPCDYCQLAVVEGACTETLCDDAMTKWLQQPYEEERENG